MTPEAQLLISNRDKLPTQRGEVDSAIEADATSVLRTAIDHVDGVRESLRRLPQIFQKAYETSEDIASLEGVVKKAIGRVRYEQLLPAIKDEVETHFPGVDLQVIGDNDVDDGVTEIFNVKNRLDAYFAKAIDTTFEEDFA